MTPLWRNWLPLTRCCVCRDLIWQGWQFDRAVVCAECQARVSVIVRRESWVHLP